MNTLTISGTVKGRTIQSQRTSGIVDTIPIDTILAENAFTLTGSFRSRNTPDRHVQLYIEVTNIAPYTNDTNTITLSGYVCKTPTYRRTPAGKEITDITLAVPRNNEQSDYIPCITWGSVAREAATLKIGDNIETTGRIQSRTYNKEGEQKTVTEVSVDKFKVKW